MRYRMKEVLRPLQNREQITVVYQGRAKARLIPIEDVPRPNNVSVVFYAFFGSGDPPGEPVADVMSRLRGSRHR